MRTMGVLTGDVVGSQQIDAAQLGDSLDEALGLLETHFGGRCDRYRGDGFQVAMARPEHTLTAAVVLRAALIRHSPSRAAIWDARIAAGVGPGELLASAPFAQARGEAFVLSGKRLDEMGTTSARLAIVTAPPGPGRALNLATRFADDIITHWTRFSAEVVLESLLHKQSQQALAQRLGRAQPTINRRLSAARWPLIRDYLVHARLELEKLCS